LSQKEWKKDKFSYKPEFKIFFEKNQINEFYTKFDHALKGASDLPARNRRVSTQLSELEKL